MIGTWCVLLAFTVPVVVGSNPAENCRAKKTWVFSVSGNRRPFNFEDDKGNLLGFDLDVVREVCRIAGKTCAFTVQPFTECVQTINGHFYPGRGLMSDWFDACPGYAITVDRKNAVAFTLPYYRTEARFTVQLDNPTGFSLGNLSQYTISHLTGAYTNAQCLRRLGYSPGNVTVARDLPQARQLLLNGSVQAIFSPRSRITPFEALPDVLHCDEGGVGVMVKKGSELSEWWNAAFQKLRNSGEYDKLCAAVPAKYRVRPIKCLNPVSTPQQTGGQCRQSQPALCWCLMAILMGVVVKFICARE